MYIELALTLQVCLKTIRNVMLFCKAEDGLYDGRKVFNFQVIFTTRQLVQAKYLRIIGLRFV